MDLPATAPVPNARTTPIVWHLRLAVRADSSYLMDVLCCEVVGIHDSLHATALAYGHQNSQIMRLCTLPSHTPSCACRQLPVLPSPTLRHHFPPIAKHYTVPQANPCKPVSPLVHRSWC